MNTRFNNISRKQEVTKIWLFTALLITVLAFAGCEDFFVSEVDNVNIPGTKSRLVVYSYISTGDTLVRVYVNRSVPYVTAGRVIEPVGGRALVYMGTEGGEMIALNYDGELMCYAVDADEIPVTAGRNYTLEVHFENETVEAECYIPLITLSEENLNISPPVTRTNEWDAESIEIEWRITPTATGGERYFRTGAYVKQYSIIEENGDIDTVLLNINDLWLERGSEVFAGSEGQDYRFRAELWRSTYGYPEYPYNGYQGEDGDGRQPAGMIDSVFLFVVESDIHYYRFHKSVIDYFGYDDDFPFSESVHIYTNVEGGLGVFGGYGRIDFHIPVP